MKSREFKQLLEVVFLVSIGLTHYMAMAERGMYKKCSSLLQRNFCFSPVLISVQLIKRGDFVLISLFLNHNFSCSLE